MGNYLWTSAEPIKTTSDTADKGTADQAPAPAPTPNESTPLNTAKPETNSLADAIVDHPAGDSSKSDTHGTPRSRPK